MNTVSKPFSATWKGRQSDQYQLPNPIVASKLGVRKVSTFNGFYNISTSNNIFTYKVTFQQLIQYTLLQLLLEFTQFQQSKRLYSSA